MIELNSENFPKKRREGWIGVVFTWLIAVFDGWFIFSEYDGQSPAIHKGRTSKGELFLNEIKIKTYVVKWKSMWLFVINK